MLTKNNTSSLSRFPALDLWRLFLSGLATAIVILATRPLLHRSPFIDEVVLFTNFPLNPLQAFFSPLPYANQAATPLYSAFWALLGFLSPFHIRLLSLSTLLFLSIYLLSLLLERRTFQAVCISVASILIFKPSFIMLSEMKHYGLEILATLCIVVWVVKKDPSEILHGRDLFILLATLFLGISTFPLGIIALLLHLADRYLRVGRLAKIEVAYSAVYLLVSCAYYFLVKRIVFFQVSNFPDTYGHDGITTSAKQYLSALIELLPGGGLNAIILFVLIPVFIASLRCFSNNDAARRIISFAAVSFILYLIFSLFGVYPAKTMRHLIWFSGFLWVLFSTSLSFVIDCVRHYSRSRILSYVPLVALLIISFAPMLRSTAFASSDLSGTHNNEAISQLRRMPSFKLRFWMGGESVFRYYMRHDSGLTKFSVRDWNPSPFDGVGFQSLSKLVKIDNPDTYTRRAVDMLPFARDSFRDILPGEHFLIFASHFDRSFLASNRVKGLHEALAERLCEFSARDFVNVSIYEVKCEK